MIRLLALMLAVATMVMFADSAQSAQGKHLINSNPHIARSSTPQLVEKAPHVVKWKHQTMRENVHHSNAHKRVKSHHLVVPAK